MSPKKAKVPVKLFTSDESEDELKSSSPKRKGKESRNYTEDSNSSDLNDSASNVENTKSDSIKSPNSTPKMRAKVHMKLLDSDESKGELKSSPPKRKGKESRNDTEDNNSNDSNSSILDNKKSDSIERPKRLHTRSPLKQLGESSNSPKQTRVNVKPVDEGVSNSDQGSSAEDEKTLTHKGRSKKQKTDKLSSNAPELEEEDDVTSEREADLKRNPSKRKGKESRNYTKDTNSNASILENKKSDSIETPKRLRTRSPLMQLGESLNSPKQTRVNVKPVDEDVSNSGQGCSAADEKTLTHKGHSKKQKTDKLSSIAPELEEEDTSESDDSEDDPSVVDPSQKKETRWFICSGCSKVFWQTKELFAHTCEFKKKEGFMCETCGKIYQLRSTYITHKLIHGSKVGPRAEKERPKLACPGCKKIFWKTNELFKHTCKLKKQIGFMCEICDKYYKLRSSYLNHKVIHSIKKPYKCGICGVKSNNKGGHMRHMNSDHPEAKPFHCSIANCKKAFQTYQEVLMHNLKQKHFACPYCDEPFMKEASLFTHKRKEHSY